MKTSIQTSLIQTTLIRTTLLLSFSLAAFAQQSFYFQTDFDFTVSGHPLPAGTYTLEPRTQDGVGLQIRNQQSGRSLFVNLPTQVNLPRGADPRPRVSFRCVHQECEIVAVQSVRAGLAYRRWESEPSKKDAYYRLVALNTNRR